MSTPKTPPILPRWLSLMLLLLMGYLFITGSHHKTTAPAPQQAAVTTPATPVPATDEKAAVYPRLSQATDLERWKRAVNPDYAAKAQCDFAGKPGGIALTSTTTQPGSGDGAHCTDTVPVKLTVWNTRGSAIYTGEVTLALGSQQVAAGLDSALIGIRIGETRTVILPPDALAHAKKTDAPRALLNALHPGAVALLTATRLAETTDNQ